MSDILVTTLQVGKEAQEYGKYSDRINCEYCERYGYDWCVETSLIDNTKHPYWNKILHIRACMDPSLSYDYVLFIDADACFTNYTIPVDKFVDEMERKDKLFTLTFQNKTLTGLNSGVMLFRCCVGSMKFLDTVMDSYYEFRNTSCPEQVAIEACINTPEFKEDVLRVSCRDLNAFHGDFCYRQTHIRHCMWEKGDFIMHCPRCSTEYRVQEFNKVLSGEYLVR